ncbi:hypothetical protein [Rhizobium sp.]|jgi:hypothetical protein|uniref:hypothetical protein n=1 Tax=Rhizobium sp. TaxID=391 RepID=UPI000DBAD185
MVESAMSVRSSMVVRTVLAGVVLLAIADGALAQAASAPSNGGQAQAAPGAAPAQAAGSAAPSPQGCDTACVIANMDRAGPACTRAIEARAPIDFDWLTRPFTGVFQEADPVGGASPVVVYRGDSIRFLTPRGQWVRHTYECPFDVAAGAIGPVKVWAGRIGQPMPAAAVAGKPTAPAAPKSAGAADGKVDGKALAAAISQAVQARGAQAAKPARQPAKAPARIKLGEVSPVEVEQMDMDAQR